jgi:hypothetical protein
MGTWQLVSCHEDMAQRTSPNLKSIDKTGTVINDY